ncbi:5-formyltetrahydrofolate cyclo-ligase [Chromatium weissei]|nr:5-formyltetrahydrofolate cyclo-ligase [Chromatium weissei]
MSNTIIRRELRTARRQLHPRQQRQHAIQVLQHLRRHRWFLNARHIAFYWAADGELNLLPLLQYARLHSKTCYLPVLKPQRTCWGRGKLWFARYRSNDHLQPNRFGIPEPRSRNYRLVWQLDLILLPLVGFDAKAHRLGMGGGFYDRTLAPLQLRHTGRRPHLIGIAHDCQRVACMTPKPWDIPLNAVVTERQIYSRQLPVRTSLLSCRTAIKSPIT